MTVPNPIRAVGINSPACLPLGVVLSDEQPALLGLSLMYPPVTVAVKPLGELSVTGACAQIGRPQAQRWFESRKMPPKAEVEIELAIPAMMGLGSEALLGLSLGRGLDEYYQQQVPPSLEAAAVVGLGAEWALEAHCFAAGGLQVVSKDGVSLRRRAIQHEDKNAWVFVIYLPRPAKATPPDLEAESRRALLQAAPVKDVAQLWAALEADDAAVFAAELMEITEASRRAMVAAGAPQMEAVEAGRVIEAIRQKDGLAWGQSLGGLGIWGLVKGAGPSQGTRILMRQVVGYEAGTVTAAVTDNVGAKIQKI